MTREDNVSTTTLPAGVRRAVHVQGPALKKRREDPASTAPHVVAVREKRTGFLKAILVRRAHILGPSWIEETFDNPLPGTTAIAVIMTDAAIEITYDGETPDATQ